jgi:hypothetical protein
MRRNTLWALAGSIAAVGAAVAAYWSAFVPWERRWGATDEEIARHVPGEELVPEPHLTTTRAVTIQARPEEIWPWLVQIGYGRAGFYSYDWIERQLGLPGIESASTIRPELQRLQVGDTVPLSPEGPMIPVTTLEPNRLLVFAGYDPRMGGALWSFELLPLDREQTRLVTRLRAAWPGWTLRSVIAPAAPEPELPQANPVQGLLMYLFFDPGSFVLMRRMLLGIRERAERLATARRARTAPETAAAAG